MTSNRQSTDPMTVNTTPKGTNAMLMFEDLARARMREAQHSAEHQRLARRLNTTRRWQRVAGWATQHADKAAREL